jgi:hypothetical protein
MRRRLAAVLAPWPLAAHMVSLSTGELRLEGRLARYELRMPLYEIVHVRNPERELTAAVRFAGAQLRESSCAADAAAGAYLCRATYEFPEPVEEVEVESRLHAVTVPNHVHLLRAVKGDKSDQAVLDLSFPRATLRFEPPTAFDIAVRQMGAGLLRAAAGAAQLLFVLALVLAARGRRELVALGAMFVAGEAVSCLAAPYLGFRPAARFIEAAAALTIAYLAAEVLLLPAAGGRWAVAGVLGTFHGLYFAEFVRSSGYRAAWVLLGAAAAEVTLLGVLGLASLRGLRAEMRARVNRMGGGLLLMVGLVWFGLRLRSG